ncbi:MAG TPA: SdiA-regulated domain-containing protein [Gemmatimonadaceae bacterium]
MMGARAVTLMLSVVASATACSERSEARAAQTKELLAKREAQLEQRLVTAGARTDTPVAMWMMPPELREISGLALTSDGRLLAHDDEIGRVYVLDARRGVILKRFTLSGAPHADFEGITVAGSSIYLIASNGTLYEFREGADGASVPYRMHDTHLGHECDFEGITYQADSAWLVLPCKVVATKRLQNQVVIYRWKISEAALPRLSMMTIPLATVVGDNGWKTFHPSDITIDPATGNYVIVTSHERALAEITPQGQVIRSGPLPKGHHQPEGVAVTRDGILIVSDEATKKPAAITLYRWRP